MHTHTHTHAHTHTHTVKENLQASAVLMILGVVLSFVSLCLFLPFLHWAATIVADVLAVLTGGTLYSAQPCTI